MTVPGDISGAGGGGLARVTVNVRMIAVISSRAAAAGMIGDFAFCERIRWVIAVPEHYILNIPNTGHRNFRKKGEKG
jgi:hypothetical protein